SSVSPALNKEADMSSGSIFREITSAAPSGITTPSFSSNSMVRNPSSFSNQALPTSSPSYVKGKDSLGISLIRHTPSRSPHNRHAFRFLSLPEMPASRRTKYQHRSPSAKPSPSQLPSSNIPCYQ